MKKIIVIEDDAFKAKAVTELMGTLSPGSEIDLFTSYNTGLRNLLKNKYDLLILDMSMPTFTDDYLNTEPSFEKFAGLMILKDLKRKKALLPTILFTMFDDFGSKDYSISLQEINTQLRNDYDNFYLGYVYYEPSSDNWVESIKIILQESKF